MKSLFPDHIDLTARVMDFQIQRQNIVSGNLANINTPGYKARTLEFEKDLQADVADGVAACPKGIHQLGENRIFDKPELQ